MYLDSALVVCAVPGDCSALLAINPSPGLKDSYVGKAAAQER